MFERRSALYRDSWVIRKLYVWWRTTFLIRVCRSINLHLRVKFANFVRVILITQMHGVVLTNYHYFNIYGLINLLSLLPFATPFHTMRISDILKRWKNSGKLFKNLYKLNIRYGRYVACIFSAFLAVNRTLNYKRLCAKSMIIKRFYLLLCHFIHELQFTFRLF